MRTHSSSRRAPYRCNARSCLLPDGSRPFKSECGCGTKKKKAINSTSVLSAGSILAKPVEALDAQQDAPPPLANPYMLPLPMPTLPLDGTAQTATGSTGIAHNNFPTPPISRACTESTDIAVDPALMYAQNGGSNPDFTAVAKDMATEESLQTRDMQWSGHNDEQIGSIEQTEESLYASEDHRSDDEDCQMEGKGKGKAKRKQPPGRRLPPEPDRNPAVLRAKWGALTF